MIGAFRSWQVSWREITTQRGLHLGRQIIKALSREHDWPGGQSGLPLSTLGREGLPGLKIELLGEMYRQHNPMAFNSAAVVTISSTDATSSLDIYSRPSMSPGPVSRNDRTPTVRADG